MAVAAPKRRSATAPAPAPSRTAPPKRRKASAAPAPARPKPRRAPAKPQRARATAAPARAPQRTRPKPKRAATQPRLALVVGRTAATVRDLPDSGLIVRMTRGRAWIAVLGVLLVGIVALNVVTLSFAATQGKIDEQITALENENSALATRASKLYAIKRIRHEAGEGGLTMAGSSDPQVIKPSSEDVSIAATRLAGTGG
ncbi:MAG TPA: hypothetical protein VMT37_07725 [Solirubrobacterales bacterium]|nr:hypothetical protein [Solirubrobacterales bacterium]